MKKLILASVLTFFTSAAFAQFKGGMSPIGGAKVDKCLQMATNDDLLREVSRRMQNNNQPYPGGPNTSPYSCMVVDKGYYKTFLGQGSSKLAAEAQARENCGKSVSSSYCNTDVKCAQKELNSTGAFCIITDSGYGKTFSASGVDIVDAEANAKIKCQTSVSPSYCGNVVAKCEVTY